MKLSGSATIGHPVGDVYAAFTNPAILVRTLPGCQRLEQTGPDAYQATLEAGVGSIKGLFDGDVRLTDLAAPDSFTLHASGAGKPGTVAAVAHVRLVADAASGGTQVHYAADATVGGVIGGVGQRMLAGVARRTADEFFAAVGRELTAAAEPPARSPAAASPAVAVPAPVVPAVAPAVAPSGAPAVRAAIPRPAPPVPGQQRVWTRPAPASPPRSVGLREVLLAGALGGLLTLLGVLVGALVAR